MARGEDEARAVFGPGPLRFALAEDVTTDSTERGTWDRLPDGSRLWRLRVHSPNATNLNFGFSRYRLPPGALFSGPAIVEERLRLYRAVEQCPSDLTQIERQTAAFVASTLNGTAHCASGLRLKLESLGLPPTTLDAIEADVEGVSLDAKEPADIAFRAQ